MKTSTLPRHRHEAANVGVIVLIVLSLGLCGLAAYQWTRETTFRQRIEELNKSVVDLKVLQNEADNKAVRYQNELANVEKARADIVSENRTNKVRISRLELEISKLGANYLQATNLVTVFSNAVQQANQNILIQNDSIKKLNEDFKKLADDRNDLVKKYNTLAEDSQQTILKYNELVKQFEDYQKQVEEQLNPKKDKK